MPDTCLDCQHLREAGATYYYCGISGQTLGYESGVDESAWAGDDGCPLDRHDGDHAPLDGYQGNATFAEVFLVQCPVTRYLTADERAKQ